MENIIIVIVFVIAIYVVGRKLGKGECASCSHDCGKVCGVKKEEKK